MNLCHSALVDIVGCIFLWYRFLCLFHCFLLCSFPSFVYSRVGFAGLFSRDPKATEFCAGL